MRARLVAIACLAVLALAGCGDDDSPATRPDLLQRSDVGDVTKVTVNDQPNVSRTSCAAMEGEWNLIASAEDFHYAEFALKGGGTVSSAVIAAPSGSDSISPTVQAVDAMIDECTATAPPSGTFTRLDDLPDGAIGFVATQDTSDGLQTTERAYATVDEAHAAVVTVVHTGEGEPPVSIDDLVRTAVKRARDA